MRIGTQVFRSVSVVQVLYNQREANQPVEIYNVKLEDDCLTSLSIITIRVSLYIGLPFILKTRLREDVMFTDTFTKYDYS